MDSVINIETVLDTRGMFKKECHTDIGEKLFPL